MPFKGRAVPFPTPFAPSMEPKTAFQGEKLSLLKHHGGGVYRGPAKFY